MSGASKIGAEPSRSEDSAEAIGLRGVERSSVRDVRNELTARYGNRALLSLQRKAGTSSAGDGAGPAACACGGDPSCEACGAKAGTARSVPAEAGLSFERREHGSSTSHAPSALLSRLEGGRGLDARAARMASVFSSDFSEVRIHTDAKAAALADEFDARAFTVGSHIVFGAGEYRPGTLVGDALIAHELAHVVQQSGGEAATDLGLDRAGGDRSLEDEADHSAVGAVLSLWGGVRSRLANLGRNAVPRLRSGLKLQRCRRSVKRCPPGKSWQVIGQPAGLGSLGCVCSWRCLPGGAVPSSDSSQPTIGCPPGVACDRPSIEVVGDDYAIDRQGRVTSEPEGVTGYGAHFTPLTAPAMCGCMPLDIEGVEQSGSPLVETGFDPTSFWTGAAPGRPGDAPGRYRERITGGRNEIVVQGRAPARSGLPVPELPSRIEPGSATVPGRGGSGAATMPLGPIGVSENAPVGRALPAATPGRPVLLYDSSGLPMLVSEGRASRPDWRTTPGGGSLLVDVHGDPLAGGGRRPPAPLLDPFGRPLAPTGAGPVIVDLQAGRPDFLLSRVAQVPGARGIGLESGDWLLGYQGIHPVHAGDLDLARQIVRRSPMWPDTPAWRSTIDETPRLQNWQIDPWTYLYPQQGPVVIRPESFFGPIGGTIPGGERRLVPWNIQDVEGIVPSAHPELHGLGEQVYLRRPFGLGRADAPTTSALAGELGRILPGRPSSFLELRLRASSEFDASRQLPVVERAFPGARVVTVNQAAIERFLENGTLPADPVQAETLRSAESDLRGDLGPLGRGVPRRIIRIYFGEVAP